MGTHVPCMLSVRPSSMSVATAPEPHIAGGSATTFPISQSPSAPHGASTVARKTALRQVTCAPSGRTHPSPSREVAASVRYPCSPSGCWRCSGCGSSTRRCYRLDSAGRRSRRPRGRKARVCVGVGCARCGYKRGANPFTTFVAWRESEGRWQPVAGSSR
jgi:hypothetical protein